MNIVCVPTQLCDPGDCSQPGSFGHEIFQARILECIAISYSRGSSQPRDQTRFSCVSCIWQAESLPLHHLGSSNEHWGACIGVGVLDHMVVLYLVVFLFLFFFLKKLHTIVHNEYTNLPSHHQCRSVSFSPHLSSIYCFQILLLIVILTGVK